jgi:hypothetical protein
VSELVPTEDIEAIVGAKRDYELHLGRAVSAEGRVYVLHSQRCLLGHEDLRQCRYSLALDKGINPEAWVDREDVPVELGIHDGRLYPVDELFSNV